MCEWLKHTFVLNEINLTRTFLVCGFNFPTITDSSSVDVTLWFTALDFKMVVFINGVWFLLRERHSVSFSFNKEDVSQTRGGTTMNLSVAEPDVLSGRVLAVEASTFSQRTSSGSTWHGSCILYLCSVFLAVVTIYSQCLCFLWSSSNKFEDISIYIKQIKPIRLWNAFFSDPFPSVAHHVCILQFLSVKMWFSECRRSKWSLTHFSTSSCNYLSIITEHIITHDRHLNVWFSSFCLDASAVLFHRQVAGLQGPAGFLI